MRCTHWFGIDELKVNFLNTKCESWGNRDVYGIPIKEGINMLTNQKDGKFIITEMEVWQVKEIEKE